LATSKIIKDFTSADISIEIALKKLRVLLSNLNDDKLTNWTKYELEGYDKGADLPKYRVVTGRILSTLIVGTVYDGIKYTNYPLNLVNLSPEKSKEILSSNVYQSVSSLEVIVNERTTTQKPLPPQIYEGLATLCGINANILSAHVEFDYTVTQDILAKINGKILDTLLTLEKEFGNLDDLDIDISKKNENQLKTIVQNIQVNLYDNSISIGDNNKIKHSDIVTNK